MEQVHWKDLQAHMTHTCEALINCTQNICFNNLVHRAAMCENADMLITLDYFSRYCGYLVDDLNIHFFLLLYI